jgi:ankyrin repeat protein
MEEQQRDPRFYQLRNAVRADLEEAARIVAADPSIVQAKNSLGETALHYLVVENDFEAVEWLRLRGSDIDPTNINGNTPLDEAAVLGYLEMCQYLVSHGANPRHINHIPHGDTSTLYMAASSNQIDVLKYLLGLLGGDESLNRYFSDLEIFYINEHSPQSAEILKARGLDMDVEFRP